ncbi:hypothetical protein QOT17_022777 [Balamuthia mandrillaris]
MHDIVYPTSASSTVIHNSDVKARHDSSKPLCEFAAGSKSLPEYSGPYTVIRRNRGGAYLLQDNTGVTLPDKFSPNQLKLVAPPENSAPDGLPPDEYEIDEILTHKGPANKRKYLVHWKGTYMLPSSLNAIGTSSNNLLHLHLPLLLKRGREEYAEAVCQFCMSHSHLADNQTATLQRKSKTKPAVVVPKRYWNKPKSAIYASFQEAHPEKKISYTTFDQLCPKNIAQCCWQTAMCSICLSGPKFLTKLQ